MPKPPHIQNVRSSARLKAKNSTTSSETSHAKSTAKNNEKNPSTESHRTKRQKIGLTVAATEEKKTRRPRKKLRFLVEIPLEILFEIFSHMRPEDIFNLSQSCMSFHNVLYSPSAAPIWKSAFSNIKGYYAPPSLPSDMCPIQYTSLLYGRNCNFCSSKNAIHVHWAARLRLCTRCLGQKAFISHGATDVHHGLVPSFYAQRPGIDKQSRNYRIKKHFEDVRKQLEDLEGQVDELAKFTAQKTKETHAAREFAHWCSRWESGHLERRQAERQVQIRETRSRRKTAIINNLKELGWGQELEILGPLGVASLPGVDQPRELTPRVWKNIRDHLIATLEELKESRLEKERIGTLRRRIDTFKAASKGVLSLHRSAGEATPTFADFFIMEPFRTLILGSPVELTEDSVVASLNNAPNACLKWRKSCNQKLLQLVPGRSSDASLELATVFFRCHWCTDPISYPRILKHSCLLNYHSGMVLDKDSELHHANFLRMPWNYGENQVTFDEEASSHSSKIIKACGEDTTTITTPIMESRGHRVECLSCAHPSRGRLAMDWKSAILHAISNHYNEEVRWKLIDDENDLGKIKEKEATGMRTWRQLDLQCSLCHFSMPSRDGLKKHLRQQHSIPDDDVENNIVLPLDSPMYQPPHPVRFR